MSIRGDRGLPLIVTVHPPVPADHVHRWHHYSDGSGNSVCACGAQQESRESGDYTHAHCVIDPTTACDVCKHLTPKESRESGDTPDDTTTEGDTTPPPDSPDRWLYDW